MSPIQQALALVETLGGWRAVAHVEFVLSPKFGLKNENLRLYWADVYFKILNLINRETDSLTVEEEG
jgi:hypothetical protein